MLILTRKVGESIRIGDDIEVLITAVDHNKVRIGIRSPRTIPVYREELYQKIKTDNSEAARVETIDLEEALHHLPVEGRQPLALKAEGDTGESPSE